MIFKLKTSKRTDEIFKDIDRRTSLKPFTLVKHAIAWSVCGEKSLQDNDFETDNLGMELNRQTITGNHDAYYKAIIEQYHQKQLTDDEYFPAYVKAHIDRGALILQAKFKHAGSIERYILESMGIGDTV